MSKKILVTGGSGYIGSHTVVELIKQGYQPIIVDNLVNSDIDTLHRIEEISNSLPAFGEIDICDYQAFKEFAKKQGPIDGIIHFAALKAVGESVEKPGRYYKNNLVGLLNVLQLMEEENIPNMIFSSSCTVYGEPEKLPVSESTPVQAANSPYGNTKQIGEEIIRECLSANKILKCIALRYFNPIGAHPSGKLGELPLGRPNNLMPYITQTAIGLRDALSVFGGDYPTPDGSAIRDYIHVIDLAKAHIIALKRIMNADQKENYEVFNIGTGNGYSVLEVIRSFEKTSGQKLNYKIVDRREGDIIQIYAATDLAENELGWKPELGLDDMTSSAWEWEKNYRSKKK